MANHAIPPTSSGSALPENPVRRLRSKRRSVVIGIIVILLSIPVIKVTLVPAAAGFDGYNYSSFRHVINEQNRSGGLAPGDDFPLEFNVYDLNGKAIKLNNLWADKPLVLEFGSASCPIFHGNGPSMEDLYRKYDKGTGDKARIGLLYTREAHPGWFQDAHASLDDKLANADKLKKKGLTRPIWVDSLKGELHQLLDPKPNSVYIVNTDGKIIYKSAWNAPLEVDRVLDNLVNRQIVPAANESNYCTNPAQYYSKKDMFAYISRIVIVGGPDALPDFLINELMAGNDEPSNPNCQVEL